MTNNFLKYDFYENRIVIGWVAAGGVAEPDFLRRIVGFFCGGWSLVFGPVAVCENAVGFDGG